MKRAIRSPVLAALAALLAGCAAPFEGEPSYRPQALEASPEEPASRQASAAVPGAPGGAPAAQAAEPSKPLSLEECLGIAARNNRNLRIADRRVLIAQDRVNEAYSNLYPKVNATGRYEARSNDMGGKIGDMKAIMGDRQVWTAGVSAIVPIYLFGRVKNQGEAELLRVDVSDLDAQRVRQDLDLHVSQAYYRILEAEKLQGVVDESIRVVERQLEISRDFYGQGLVAKSDVLQAEVQLAERKQQRIQAENNIQLATAALNRLLGFDVNRPTRVADVLEAVAWRGSFEAALRVAIEKRPDLAAMKHLVEIQQWEYRAARSAFFPYLYATGDYNYSSNSFLLNDDWFSGAIVLEFPLFDRTTHVKLQKKRKEIEEAIDLRDDRVDDVVLEVKQAYLDVREASERIPVARKSIDQAEENLRIVRDQYSQGLLSSSDVLTEEDRLAQARARYYRSLYDYHAAFARLANAIGGRPPEAKDLTGIFKEGISREKP